MGRKGSRTRETEAQLPKVNLTDSPGASAGTLEARARPAVQRGPVVPTVGRPEQRGWGPGREDSMVGTIPRGRKWLPSPVFLPGEVHGQRSLVGYSPWSCKESDID